MGAESGSPRSRPAERERGNALSQIVTWMRLETTAPPEVLEALASLLTEWGSGGVVEGEGRLTAYFPPPAREEVEARLRRYAADLGRPVAWRWEAETGEPWREAWKAYFRPSRVSARLAVCPSWEEWAPEDPAVRVIRMDPGRAFGTGTHETTRLCLGILDDLLAGDTPPTLLDVGCGSGILSVAARLLGVPRVVALDLDPLAAEATRENAAANGVDAGLLVLQGDLRSVRTRFPLVVANILYQVLLGLAPGLCERVAPGGRLVLSGMLASELTGAAAHYARHGLREVRREVDREWGALVLRRA